MPGTISKGIACFAKCKASSPPRPKTKGSPPFKRTTFYLNLLVQLARVDFVLRHMLVSSCFPAKIRSTDAGINSKIESETSLSKIITSAEAIAQAALTVKRSGSPGPAPTNSTGKMRGRSVIPVKFSQTQILAQFKERQIGLAFRQAHLS